MFLIICLTFLISSQISNNISLKSDFKIYNKIINNYLSSIYSEISVTINAHLNTKRTYFESPARGNNNLIRIENPLLYNVALPAFSTVFFSNLIVSINGIRYMYSYFLYLMWFFVLH